MNSLSAESQAVRLQSLNREKVWQLIQNVAAQPDTLKSNWCVPPESGRFLHLLTRIQNATKIIEVGTSIGFSTVHLALGVAENLKTLADTPTSPAFVCTIDASKERQEKAKELIQQAELSELLDFKTGSALDVLKEQAPFWHENIDLAFIDARKDEYLQYTEILYSCLRPGGLLIADNTHSHRKEMQPFIDFILNQDRQEAQNWDSCDLDTANGLVIARKRN